MPFSVKFPSVLSERAVAKTRKPLAANSKANALPAPPWEHLITESQRTDATDYKALDAHPVIRIDLLDDLDMVYRK